MLNSQEAITNKEDMKERIRWWACHPRFELIYLLGGIPKEHINTLNYRNIVSAVDGITKKYNQYHD